MVVLYPGLSYYHQYCCIRHSSGSRHSCSLRDLSLACSRSLGLTRCNLGLRSSGLLLLGQLLGLLLLCKGLQTKQK